MKLEVNENGTLQLEEVFNGVVIKTTDGVKFHICQRDYGIEITCNGVTKYLDEETFNTKEKMTPKEKAEELVQRFIYRTTEYVEIDDSKQCALIAVNEIIKSLDDVLYPNPFNQYWVKVKQEIKNL